MGHSTFLERYLQIRLFSKSINHLHCNVYPYKGNTVQVPHPPSSWVRPCPAFSNERVTFSNSVMKRVELQVKGRVVYLFILVTAFVSFFPLRFVQTSSRTFIARRAVSVHRAFCRRCNTLSKGSEAVSPLEVWLSFSQLHTTCTSSVHSQLIKTNPTILRAFTFYLYVSRKATLLPASTWVFASVVSG